MAARGPRTDANGHSGEDPARRIATSEQTAAESEQTLAEADRRHAAAERALAAADREALAAQLRQPDDKSATR